MESNCKEIHKGTTSNVLLSLIRCYALVFRMPMMLSQCSEPLRIDEINKVCSLLSKSSLINLIFSSSENCGSYYEGTEASCAKDTQYSCATFREYGDTINRADIFNGFHRTISNDIIAQGLRQSMV